MPRVRNIDREEVINGIKMAFIDTEQVVGKNPDNTDKVKQLQYSVPADPQAFKQYVLSQPDATFNEEKDQWEGHLATIHAAFWAGYDTKLRQEQRESVVAESTEIMVDKKKVDLMKLPVQKLIMAINGTLAAAAATGREPQNAFVVARRKLIEQGDAKDNASTGMLEAVQK